MLHQLLSIEVNRLKALAAHCEELGDYLTEYWCLKRLLELSQEDCVPTSSLAELHFDLGLTCAALDKIDEATRSFSRALDLYRQESLEESFEVQECLRNLRAMDCESKVFPMENEHAGMHATPLSL